MNKFSISDFIPEHSNNVPVLYKVYFSNRYYIHKGKELQASLDRFLDDVDRGIRGKSCPESYLKVVAYCKQYPAIHKVTVEVIINDEAPKILKKEASLLKSAYKDELSLHDPEKPPYTPEWMLKDKFAQRCDDSGSKCLKTGSIAGKKTLFRFCPNCGRLNKKASS